MTTYLSFYPHELNRNSLKTFNPSLKILAMFVSSAIDVDAGIIVALSAADLFVLTMISIPTSDILAVVVFADLLVAAMIVLCALNSFARVSDASFFILAVVVCSTSLSVTLVSEAQTVTFRTIFTKGVQLDVVAGIVADAFDVNANTVDFIALLKAARFLATVIVDSTFSRDTFVVDASCFFIASSVANAADGFAFVVLADL